MEPEQTNTKIRHLTNLLALHGYVGEFHINGIEQGSLEQVIKRCIALKEGGKASEFKDPVVLSHFSYNATKTQYLQSFFSVELDQGDRFQLKSISFNNSDLDHTVLGSAKVKIRKMEDIPTKERIRDKLTPKSEEEKKKSRGLKR